MMNYRNKGKQQPANFVSFFKYLQNFLTLRFSSLFLLLALFVGSQTLVSCGGSKSSSRKNKTIKKGKPTPCPFKDC
jgi:hypothetical protein